MHIPTPSRTLLIPLDDRELAVTVTGDIACLDVVAARGRPADPEASCDAAADPGPDPVRIRVPARALVAALRVAWADEHDLRCFEPWRDVTPNGRWNGYRDYDPDGYGGGYGYGYRDDGGRWYDDLGDGDPDGYRDPTVISFPYRPGPPGPKRSGAAWEQWEHEAVRETWLAAAPDADKKRLVAEIAECLERGVGGVSARLRLAGCDPTRPGSEWNGTYDDPAAAQPDDHRA